MSDIPRRAQMSQWHQAERAIFEASVLVESMGADPRLTQAQNLLRMARHSVADFIDNVTDANTRLILAEFAREPRAGL